MGNTHTHRGGRRSGGRHPRDAQAAPRGPGVGSPPAGRAPRAPWPRPAQIPAVGGPSAPLGTMPGAHPPSGGKGRGKGQADAARNGAGQGRPADQRHAWRDPFASPPPSANGFAAPASPTWAESDAGGRHGSVTPPPTVPLVHLNGNSAANGHLALVPAPAADTAALPAAPDTPEMPDMPAAPDAETWTPRSERSKRAAHAEREHEPLRPGVRGDVGPLIEALHDVFERDRAIASQGNSTRCGICYLHYERTELIYREAEGFYACPTCTQSLGAAPLNMVRRQQK